MIDEFVNPPLLFHYLQLIIWENCDKIVANFVVQALLFEQRCWSFEIIHYYTKILFYPILTYEYLTCMFQFLYSFIYIIWVHNFISNEHPCTLSCNYITCKITLKRLSNHNFDKFFFVHKSFKKFYDKNLFHTLLSTLLCVIDCKWSGKKWSHFFFFFEKLLNSFLLS